MGTTLNNEYTTTEPPPYNGQQPKPPGAKLNFTSQIFALDSAVVKHYLVQLAWKPPNLCNLSSQGNNQSIILL